MTDMPERIWATADIGMLGSTGRWVTQGAENPFGRAEYVRLSRILAILDAHPNASPGWLALQIREGRL